MFDCEKRAVLFAEAALSLRVVGEYAIQVGTREVRPQFVDEGELGVGELPEQKV